MTHDVESYDLDEEYGLGEMSFERIFETATKEVDPTTDPNTYVAYFMRKPEDRNLKALPIKTHVEKRKDLGPSAFTMSVRRSTYDTRTIIITNDTQLEEALKFRFDKDLWMTI